MDEAALDEYARAYAAPGAMQRGFDYYRAIFDSIAQNQRTAARQAHRAYVGDRRRAMARSDDAEDGGAGSRESAG
jgi:DNA-binding FadR family transcriptional regulator